MISVDWDHPALDADGLRSFISSSHVFRNWWNHIPTLFLVESEFSADEITEKLKKFSRDANLLVMEVNPQESEGWLPERGWNWIRRRSDSSLPLSEA
jgi:hypothetical protein